MALSLPWRGTLRSEHSNASPARYWRSTGEAGSARDAPRTTRLFPSVVAKLEPEAEAAAAKLVGVGDERYRGDAAITLGDKLPFVPL